MTSVEGPLDGGVHGWPFGASAEDLGALGYVEEEYLLSGTAQAYQPARPLTPDGRWAVQTAGTAPFTTRLLVRRPTDPARFNGVVVVEWVNVTSGFELSSGAGPSVFDGFAHVVVSTQYVGVHGLSTNPMGLVAWDPERYGRLEHPGDRFCYDIFTQDAQAVARQRPQGGADPLGGLDVRAVVALGASQSGQRLLTYANAVQPEERTFDGFLSTVSIGRAAGFGDAVMDPAAFATATPEQLAELRGFPSLFREDLDVPVFVVNSECETLSYAGSRQPDTDVYRFWEIAGASHAPAQMMAAAQRVVGRDFQMAAVAGGGLTGGEIPPSRVEWLPTADAALQHLRRWVLDATAPPVRSRITLDAAGQVARDEHGNARGGVRLPEVEVPLAGYDGGGLPPHPVGLGGRTAPFSAAELAALYPTHEDYVAQVGAAADAAVTAGVITPRRAQEYREEAQTAAVPR